MGFLHILSWTGAGAGSLLVVVSLAAGLYYLAELIEVRSYFGLRYLDSWLMLIGIHGRYEANSEMGVWIRCSVTHSPLYI